MCVYTTTFEVAARDAADGILKLPYAEKQPSTRQCAPSSAVSLCKGRLNLLLRCVGVGGDGIAWKCAILFHSTRTPLILRQVSGASCCIALDQGRRGILGIVGKICDPVTTPLKPGGAGVRPLDALRQRLITDPCVAVHMAALPNKAAASSHVSVDPADSKRQ